MKATLMNMSDILRVKLQYKISTLNSNLGSYKLNFGTISVSVTANTNKTLNFCGLPSGWKKIIGVIATPNYNPYAYSTGGLYAWSSDNICTMVIVSPSITTNIKISYVIFGE